MILPYNRVVKDLNGLEKEGFLKKAEEKFEIHLLGKEAFARIRREPLECIWRENVRSEDKAGI